MNEPSEETKKKRLIALRIMLAILTILFFASGLWFLGILPAFLFLGSVLPQKNKPQKSEEQLNSQIITHEESSQLIQDAQQELSAQQPISKSENSRRNSFDNPENYVPFNCPIKDYHIAYRDRAGDITERDITVNQFYCYENGNNSWWNLYLKAFCHLRNENRTFHIQSIEKLFVDDTEIHDIQGYFESIITGTQKWQCIKAISEHYIELKFLVFLSRAANGKMHRNQRDIIAKYISKFTPNLPFDELSNEIKFVTCEMKEFNKLLKSPRIPAETVPQFMECAAELLMLRKTPDPMENATFQKIKKALRIS